MAKTFAGIARKLIKRRSLSEALRMSNKRILLSGCLAIFLALAATVPGDAATRRLTGKGGKGGDEGEESPPAVVMPPELVRT